MRRSKGDLDRLESVMDNGAGLIEIDASRVFSVCALVLGSESSESSGSFLDMPLSRMHVGQKRKGFC